MRAISLWQPWATLVAIGAKKFETRHWHPRYQGPLAIHAALRPPRMDELNRAMVESLEAAGFSCCGELIRLRELPRGAVVAIADLGEAVSTDAFVPAEPERSFGNYASGRFAWQLLNVRRLKSPYTYKGRQKWFEVPDELALQCE